MRIFVITDFEGEVHGAFTTDQKAYDYIEKYIMTGSGSFEEKCAALDEFRDSYDRWKDTSITWGVEDMIYCTPTILT